MRKPIYAAALLAIAGQAHAANLVRNGDFSAGNSGFTTGYRYIAPGPNTLRGNSVYTIATNARTANSTFGSFGDHTNGRGNYLVADGSTTAGTVIWQQSNISFVSGTEYIFKGYFAAATTSNRSRFDAYYSVDGGANSFLGNWYTDRPVGVWHGMEARFVPRGRLLTITIFNRTLTAAGNDFALDDIGVIGLAPVKRFPTAELTSRIAAVPEPASWAMMIAGFGLVGVASRRRRAPATA